VGIERPRETGENDETRRRQPPKQPVKGTFDRTPADAAFQKEQRLAMPIAEGSRTGSVRDGKESPAVAAEGHAFAPQGEDQAGE
jgi:hypothetical protein